MWMFVDFLLFLLFYVPILGRLSSRHASSQILVAIAAWLAFVTLPAYILSLFHLLTMQGWLIVHALLALPGLVRMVTHGVDPWRRGWRHLTAMAQVLPGGRGSVFFALIYLFLVVLALLVPPYDTDSLVYHLPRAALWLQESTTWVVTGVNARIDSMGLNGSLVMAWAMAFWPHAHAPGLVMILFFTLAWVAVFDRLSCVGKSVPFRMWLALLMILAIPHVFNQMIGVGMDLIVIACILAFLALTYFSAPPLSGLLAGSVYLGFAVGAKGSVIPLVAILGPAFAWRLLRQTNSIRDAIGRLILVGVVAGLFVLPGWFQNLMLSGHPFGSEWLRVITTDAGLLNLLRQGRFFLEGFRTWFDVGSFLPILVVPLLGIPSVRREVENERSARNGLLVVMAVSVLFQAWVTRSSELSNFFRLALPTLVLGMFLVPSCIRYGTARMKSILVIVLAFSCLLQVATVVGPFRQGLLVQKTDHGFGPGQLFSSERVDFRHLGDEHFLMSKFPYADLMAVRVGFVGRGSSYFLFGRQLQHSVVYLNPSLIDRLGVDQAMREYDLDYLWSPLRILEENDMSGIDKGLFHGRSMNELIEGKACTWYDLAEVVDSSRGNVVYTPSGSTALVYRQDR